MLQGESLGTMQYKCSNHKLIREEYIEEFLLSNLTELANRYIEKNSILKINVKKDNSKKIKEIQNKLYKLKDLYLDDLIDKESYKKDYEVLSKNLAKLKNETSIPIKKDFSKLQKTINSNFLDKYLSLTTEEKRTFWINIVDKIYVKNGKIIEVIFL